MCVLTLVTAEGKRDRMKRERRRRDEFKFDNKVGVLSEIGREGRLM